MRVLENAEKELEDYNYEVNYSITKDGKVWRVSGESSSVNPTVIPSNLAGSYSYHNHPEAETNYSFSAEDVAFFIWSGEDVSVASDNLFVYAKKIGSTRTLRRPGTTRILQQDNTSKRQCPNCKFALQYPFSCNSAYFHLYFKSIKAQSSLYHLNTDRAALIPP